MPWWLFSFWAMLLVALMAEVNRLYKMDAALLNFWRTLGATCLLSPVLLVAEQPADYGHWGVIFFTGLVAAFVAQSGFYIAAKHNGRVAALRTPVIAVLTFVFWLVASTEEQANVVAHPLQFIGSLSCILVAVVAMLAMLKNTVSRQFLPLIFSISFMVAMSNVLVKMMFEGQNVFLAAVNMMFWVMLVQALFSYTWMRSRRERVRLPQKKEWQIVTTLAFVGPAAGSMGWISVGLSPNPAYVTAIMMMTSVAIYAYHRMIGLRDDANPILGLVLVVSGVVLVLISTF